MDVTFGKRHMRSFLRSEQEAGALVGNKGSRLGKETSSSISQHWHGPSLKTPDTHWSRDVWEAPKFKTQHPIIDPNRGRLGSHGVSN